MLFRSVDDKTRPVCVSPLSIARVCTSDDLLNYTALFTTPASYDNCGIASTTFLDNRALSISCIASSVTRTWTFTDCQSNTTTCSQTLNVSSLTGFRITSQPNELTNCVVANGAVIGSNAWLNAEVDKTISTIQLRNCEGTRTCAADRKSTRLNSSHVSQSRMPSSA